MGDFMESWSSRRTEDKKKLMVANDQKVRGSPYGNGSLSTTSPSPVFELDHTNSRDVIVHKFMLEIAVYPDRSVYPKVYPLGSMLRKMKNHKKKELKEAPKTEITQVEEY